MEMHWVLTLQWQVPNGIQTWWGQGTTFILPGETRSTLMVRLLAEVSDAVGIPSRVNVMFFDLAPNKLNGE